MILFLHHRYRTTGGEERTIESLRRLVEDHLGEPTELLVRDSSAVGRRRAAAGLVRGGLDPEQVGSAVRRTGARVVHAHNLNPTFGWRALAAARAAGAGVVLHLHNYRLVCAVGTCFTDGEDCVRCQGARTLPGVLHNCRGAGPEAAAYAAGLALWQRRLVAQADVVVVPSAFAIRRLADLRAPLSTARVRVLPPVIGEFAADSRASTGEYTLVASRLAPEKGVDLAIDACRAAREPLVVAGDGPETDRLRTHARGADVRFVGSVGGAELRRLRDRAAVALVPSRSAETFGLAAAEAMAHGLPVVATRSGALGELVEEEGLVGRDDVDQMGLALRRLHGDEAAGRRGLDRVRTLCAAEAVGPRLREIYEEATA